MFFPCNPSAMSIHHHKFYQMERDPKWAAEVCMIGFRCLAHRINGRIDLWTRDQMRITASLPELRRQIKDMIPEKTILDGVLFGEGKKDHYFVFDIPELKGKGAGVLHQRHKLLRTLYHGQPLIQIAEQFDNPYRLWSDVRLMPKVNGIILKYLESNYLISYNRRKITHHWIKITP